MTGVVTISVEVELGWGSHDTGEYDQLSDDGSTEREYLSKLLAECERSGVPISFDVVGHLLLSACSGEHPGPHPDGWFEADPGTDYRRDPLFYAPDVVEAIGAAPTDHEICTHTFSHVLFEGASRRTAAWELERAQELHRKRAAGPTTSLVPPRHQLPPYDVLADRGIEIVRPAMERRAGSRVGRFAELLAGPTRGAEPAVTDGVVETYCETNPTLTAAALPAGRRSPHPAFRYLPVRVRRRLHLRKLRRATERAATEGTHLHLWCHLYDLSNERQWPAVRRYLRWLGSRREAGHVELATMEELNDRVRDRE